MTWTEVHAQLEAAAAHCLWQDLDGLHIEAAPQTAPPTSILWAWTASDGSSQDQRVLWRIRLDGFTARVALMYPGPRTGSVLTRWEAQDGRVRQYRGAEGVTAPLTDLTFSQYVDPDTCTGVPVSFVEQRFSLEGNT